MDNQHLLTQVDQLRLRELLDHLSAAGQVPRSHLDLLSDRVRAARVVEPREVPRDVVTMNSLVGIRSLENDEKWSCTLAYPQDASLVERKVAVTVPLGAMLLGRRVGDTLESSELLGQRRFVVERVYYQPEAAGDFHL
jgi:regulator of nucleoside diphosphate kinase